MSHRGRRPFAVAGVLPIVLLLVAIAACSHQGRYMPPEQKLPCTQRMICTGDGGRLSQSGQTCRCARLVDYNG